VSATSERSTNDPKNYQDAEALEDLSPPPRPEYNPAPESERQDDGWTGRSSKFAIAEGRTLVRNQEVLGYRYECQDCRRAGKSTPGHEIRDHQFHLRTSKVNGRQVGPDADHLAALKSDGFVKGSPEAFEWAQTMQARYALLGVEPESTCRNCRADLRAEDGSYLLQCPSCRVKNGQPELKAESTEVVARRWARDLAGGPEAVVAREAELRRQDSDELKKLNVGIDRLVKLLGQAGEK
jgi:hypothetical protein